ncbi:calcium-binding protein [Phenylobacterium sp.]|uniref:calcium-binding protein n=1 Tax=Phenylobacterium sp. TaxID=1871053 RepID=UPI002E3466A3|nr:calcium-binding protein [Phenylobacterium sp.]HEX2559667.1 calcium-binding protein [Phenylobacterium sp.]
MAVAVVGLNYAVWMDDLALENLLWGEITTATANTIVVSYGPGTRDEFYGSFVYNSAQTDVVGGVLRQIREYDGGLLAFDVHSFEVSAVSFVNWVETGATETAFSAIFGSHDSFTGSNLSDRLFGYAGNDTLYGGAGGDTLVGDAGEDFIRGEAGADLLIGGEAFDNMHGNMGSDTLYGGFGNDWVVGGQDSDWLYGEDGDDYIVANLAADTCLGAAGRDTLLGGQGDDRLSGEAGDDRISGDRGADTLSGGLGADTFDFFLEAGQDRVTDFSYAEGDRVHILGGWSYSVQQVGADTVLSLGSDQLILVGVNAASLGAGWVFSG